MHPLSDSGQGRKTHQRAYGESARGILAVTELLLGTQVGIDQEKAAPSRAA
jgi:hypothetical protein